MRSAHRWFSAAIVATLALGIGLNTMVFTLVNAVLLKPVPVPNGDRLVSVMGRNLSGDDRSVPFSYPDFQDYRRQATSFEFFEAAIPEGAVLSEPRQSAPAVSTLSGNRRNFFDDSGQSTPRTRLPAE